jgi:hypothetical protein
MISKVELCKKVFCRRKSVPDLLFSGGFEVLAVASTRFLESVAYCFTMLAPRPRVAPTTSMVDIIDL